jgi:hypothetical protein
MSFETESPMPGRQIVVGLQDDEMNRLDSKEPITCFLQGWTEKDLAEGETWTHITIKGRQYKILSSFRVGTFRVKLDE